MAKPGPKPKPGPRYENGRLVHESRRDGPPPGILARQAVIDRQLTSPKWGSKLGLMYLEEQITAPEMNAGLAYGFFVGRYDAVMGNGKRTTQAMSYGDARGGGGQPLNDEQILKLRERHADLMSIIGGAKSLVEHVCCEDRMPALGDILRLRVALRRLQPWFGVPDI